ncbi:MAG: hypothetical protein ACR2KB_06190, partial [Chitinophagaceae bacterium]
MKRSLLLLLSVIILSFSIRGHAQYYKGPIIDMHIHAFGVNEPLYGLTHPPTLRGQTFKGVTTAEEQKQQVLE